MSETKNEQYIPSFKRKKKEIMTADKSRTAKRFQMYADTVSKLTAETGNKGKKGAGK